jgi:hypothetical protein
MGKSPCPLYNPRSNRRSPTRIPFPIDASLCIALAGFLIFLTTIPPLPLYSTLIVLSGYTFGAWQGFVVSYCAALSGALIVFLLSRYFFRTSMIRLCVPPPPLSSLCRFPLTSHKFLGLVRTDSFLTQTLPRNPNNSFAFPLPPSIPLRHCSQALPFPFPR